MRSASAWQGWWPAVSMLKTGTVAVCASSSSSASGPVRTPIAAMWRDSTRAVSPTDSPRESCSSSRRSTTGWPPSSKIPASNDRRVRVEGFSKMSATLRPSSARDDSGAAFSASARSSSAPQLVAVELGPGEQVARQAGQSMVTYARMRVLTWNLFHGRAVPPAGRDLQRRVRCQRSPAGTGTSRSCRRFRRGGRRRSRAPATPSSAPR